MMQCINVCVSRDLSLPQRLCRYLGNLSERVWIICSEVEKSKIVTTTVWFQEKNWPICRDSGDQITFQRFLELMVRVCVFKYFIEQRLLQKEYGSDLGVKQPSLALEITVKNLLQRITYVLKYSIYHIVKFEKLNIFIN